MLYKPSLRIHPDTFNRGRSLAKLPNYIDENQARHPIFFTLINCYRADDGRFHHNGGLLIND